MYAASGPIAECHIDSDVDEDTQDRWEPIKEANVELIAAAVNALPALLDAADRADALEAELAALKASIEAAPVAITNGYDIWTDEGIPDLPDMRKKSASACCRLTPPC